MKIRHIVLATLGFVLCLSQPGMAAYHRSNGIFQEHVSGSNANTVSFYTGSLSGMTVNYASIVVSLVDDEDNTTRVFDKKTETETYTSKQGFLNESRRYGFDDNYYYTNYEESESAALTINGNRVAQASTQRTGFSEYSQTSFHTTKIYDETEISFPNLLIYSVFQWRDVEYDRNANQANSMHLNYILPESMLGDIGSLSFGIESLFGDFNIQSAYLYTNRTPNSTPIPGAIWLLGSGFLGLLGLRKKFA